MATMLPHPTELIPHRPPMLFLDEITALNPSKSAKGLWTPGEGEFEGHMPGRPVLPGVKTVESIVQTALCAVMADRCGDLPLFINDSAKWQLPILPGDTLENVVSINEITNDGKVKGIGHANIFGKTACMTSFVFIMVPPEKFDEILSRPSLAE